MAKQHQVNELTRISANGDVIEYTQGIGLRVGMAPDLPAASAAYRRVLMSTEGGDGVADQIVICGKDAAGDYAWLTVGAKETTYYVSAATMTDLGASATMSGSGAPVDLSPYTQVRARATVVAAGSAGSTVTPEYTLVTDGTATYAAAASALAIDETGEVVGAWETLPTEARDWVYLRGLGENGDESADPNLLLLIDLRA